MNNNNNIFFAIVLSFAILLGFQYFYVKPQQEAITRVITAQQVEKETKVTPAADVQVTVLDRADIIKQTSRIPLETQDLSGSINLKGARIDDLLLSRYHETIDPASPQIVLLSPSGSAEPHQAYFAAFDWLAKTPDIVVPTSDTIWKAGAGAKLTPDHPVTLSWDNGHGLTFEREIAVDPNTMFTVTDHVLNNSQDTVLLYPFGMVARQGLPLGAGSSVVHEGALGVIGGTLEEYKYKKLMDIGKQAAESTGGWLGITDKYWLVAMIPSQDEKITADFSFHKTDQAKGANAGDTGFYQSDFRGSLVSIAPGSKAEHSVHVFAGAKRIKLLDAYAERYSIPHFDKAIDFGWFYFLTRPFLYLLALLANSVGSIGVAILLFTVLLKLATLPLSLKSYHSMARMKALQPQLKDIQERFVDDQVRRSQEMMELYKREKINPMSGCLPMLVQIPIFFALYKVLYVNIEMRQAPFFGWIHDMSAIDPTSWWNVFGLASWGLPSPLTVNLGLVTLYLPPALHIGVWPLLMGISMFLQQKMSPPPPDQSQARLFLLMPFIFTYTLSSMPSGLVIYWTWSNLLGIVQQWYIMRSDLRRKTLKTS